VDGDIYAYLTHGSDSLVFLNRVGVANGTEGSPLYKFGYSGGGFGTVTLRDDSGINDYGNIHNYGGTTLNSMPGYRPF